MKSDLIIQRSYFDDCTLGRLFADNFQCFTLELPYLDNQTNISCIPKGAYNARKHISPSNGECIEILNVMNRTHIQIHAANYTRQIKGCIAVGDSIKFLDGDKTPDVTNSKATMVKLLKALPEEFLVYIK
jgi:hypothetical protein